MNTKPSTKNKRFVPTYQFIETDLRRRIESGEWTVGAMLPSRQGLAREYGVDLTTVQRGIATLIEDGTVRAESRRGTFVAERVSGSPSGGVAEAHSPGVRSPHDRTETDTRRALGTMGIVADLYHQIDNPAEPNTAWLGAIVPVLESTFRNAGGETKFFNRIEHKQSSDIAAVASLLESGIDALAVVMPKEAPGAIARVLSSALDVPIPLIFLSDQPLKTTLSHVFYDQQANGYQAAQHLIRCGYRRLVFLFPYRAAWVMERIEGIEHALIDAGLSSGALTVYLQDHPQFDMKEPDLAAAMAAPLLNAGLMDGCGVIAGNDIAAHGIALAAAPAGRKPGRDFGLVGFDDAPSAREMELTSVRPPFSAMAEQAATLLARALRGEELPAQIRMRPYLVPRASTFSSSRIRLPE